MPLTDDLALTVRPGAHQHTHGILIPGFLDSRLDPGIDALGDALAAAGVGSVIPDLRGTWSSPGTPADVRPSVQLDDLAVLIDRFAAVRTVLAGHCYGAQVAALAAVADRRVTDVVALMPTRCFIWPEDHDPTKDTWRDHGTRRFNRDGRTFDVPYSVVEDALTYDVPKALAGLTQRILFVAGEYDGLIGVDPVRRLFEECGSPDKEFVVLPVQHDYRDIPEQIETVNDCVLDWLSRGDDPVRG